MLQMTRRRSSTAYASTVLTTCVRWSFSRAPLCALLLCRSTSETTRSTTQCEFTHRQSLSSHASFHRTIQNTTNRLVFCVLRINFFFYDFMALYGMVNVDLYSAVITKVSNALNTLVSGEKPGFQALSKGLVVLLCVEVVRQGVPDHGAVHSECSASDSG